MKNYKKKRKRKEFTVFYEKIKRIYYYLFYYHFNLIIFKIFWKKFI